MGFWKRKITDADRLWHKPTFEPLFPVRLVDGRSSFMKDGIIWRRWNGKAWEYKLVPETFEDFLDGTGVW